MKTIDRSPPPELDNFRGLLGDAGITHTLRESYNGWPYIRFHTEEFGEISLQYRQKKKVKTFEGTITKEPHFLVFIPNERNNWNRQAGQKIRSFKTVDEVLAFVSITPEDLTKYAEHRKDWSVEDRSTPIVEPEAEASYVAMMR